MDTTRLVNIILSELSLDNMKTQDELERVINADLSSSEKTAIIKNYIKELAINELMIAKFKGMIQTETQTQQ